MMSDDSYYLISQVVEQLRGEFPDISVSKIRYFDKRGLLDLPRSQSGYRRFRQEDIDQLRWMLHQQNHNFLPLKVIKERLSSGQWKQDMEAIGQPATRSAAPSSSPARSGTQSETQPEAQSEAARPESARSAARLKAVSGGSGSAELTRAEFIQQSGLRESELRQLQQHKLFSSKKTFDQHDLEVARLSRELLPLGLEPRHLRTYALAAERQADLAERLARTLLVDSDSQKRREGVEQLHAIAVLGSDMQRVILARLLEETESGK